MTYVFSTDGTTISNQRGSLPKNLQKRLDTGEWVTPTASNAADLGWYPVVDVPRRNADHVRSIANTAPGVFTMTWTFDQALADANADQADRDADALALKADLQAMKDVRDEAATSRVEMLDGDPAFLPKWRDVKVIATDPFPDPAVDIDAWRADVEARIEDQAKLTNLIVAELRRVYGDIRAQAAAFVRKLKKDRDDE